ncbi:diacylglycerol kinase family lipid kinase [Salibacterium salarium]|uniref:Diacylglycerol kinase family lipid kinase n=1 Tax=Salibacterium salarium TaxID=284579 RepID=A0A428MZY2_9BACI|nr:diacylglycerol kinase family protein [Salibacterium salarium]RSL31678.1 diacylglycerol kinase family lipid kinase [Salibacterium salarium]
MFKNALLLLNGNMDQEIIQKNIEWTAGILSTHIEHLVIKQTQYKGHTESICREWGSMYELIIIMGGDGTVHEGVNGIAELDNPPQLGILPAGTCNDMSRSLSIPQHLKRAANTLMNGTTRYIDIGKINDRYFTNFCGIGLIADTSENINKEWKGMLGKVSYFISALQTINNTRSFPFKLRVDGKEIEDKAVMVLIANGNFIGTNQLPFHQISLDDGQCDAFIVSQGGASLLRDYLNAKNPLKWDPDQTDIKHYQGTTMELQTSAPMKADTDGEIYLETPVSVSSVPEKIPFLVSLK